MYISLKHTATVYFGIKLMPISEHKFIHPSKQAVNWNAVRDYKIQSKCKITCHVTVQYKVPVCSFFKSSYSCFTFYASYRE